MLNIGSDNRSTPNYFAYKTDDKGERTDHRRRDIQSKHLSLAHPDLFGELEIDRLVSAS